MKNTILFRGFFILVLCLSIGILTIPDSYAASDDSAKVAFNWHWPWGNSNDSQKKSSDKQMPSMNSGKLSDELLEALGVTQDEWDAMTDDEKKELMESNKPSDKQMPSMNSGKLSDELLEVLGVTQDEWDAMTDDEKKELFDSKKEEFLKEDGVDTTKEVQSQNTDNTNNFVTKNTKKAKNFKKSDDQNLKSAKTFSDNSSIKNLTAVQYLQQHGVINGYDDGSFKPDNQVSRAEAMKIILEALNEEVDTDATSTFTDVSSGQWYTAYIQKAKERGFVSGYSDGTFGPTKTINKVELLKMLFEAFGIDLSDYTIGDLYSDVSADEWYAPYVQYAKDNELVEIEDDGLFHPDKNMTRDEFSEVVYRLMVQQNAISDSDLTETTTDDSSSDTTDDTSETTTDSSSSDTSEDTTDTTAE